MEKNQEYWNGHADSWFGTTALPVYGEMCPAEEELHLFGEVAGKRLLEICCGSGHSLKRFAGREAGGEPRLGGRQNPLNPSLF